MNDLTPSGRPMFPWRSQLPTMTERPLAWLVGGLTVLLVLRLAALFANRTDLFFDEAQYWAWAQVPAFGYYSKPPLIAWLIAASTAVCGETEACVRVSSPLIHTATALAIYALASHLYDRRTGVVAALGFALIPGVSLSAGLISTDVPLLLFWSLALLGFSRLLDTKEWWPALLLGCALGFGLNAKYAMAWFVLCAGLHIAITPSARALLRDARLWIALAIGIALITPNLVWNQAHSFATFAHTADNANWSGSLGHPLKALEFLASQAAVFGPFYFAGLLVVAIRARSTRPPEPDRLMLAFSLPLIAIIAVQALLSRAHANWAAMAYVSGMIVIAATLVRQTANGWIRAGFALHAAVLAILILATSTAGLVALPGKSNPLSRTLGWHALADAVRAEVDAAREAGHPYAAILTDKRAVTAELLYYLRTEPTPVLAFRPDSRPHDHFEMSRPFTAAAGEPVLLVSLAGPVDADAAEAFLPSVARAFATARLVGERDIAAGLDAKRRVTFLALSGYKGP